MTDDLPTRAREMAAAATAGPWTVSTGPHVGLRYSVMGGGEVLATINEWSADVDKADAAFIAWCREGVPAMADEIDRLRAEVQRANDGAQAMTAMFEPVHDYLQKHKVGNGGEDIFALIAEEAERLRAENAKLNEQRLTALGLGELEREALEVVRAENARLCRTLGVLAEHEPSWSDDFCRARAALKGGDK